MDCKFNLFVLILLITVITFSRRSRTQTINYSNASTIQLPTELSQLNDTNGNPQSIEYYKGPYFLTYVKNMWNTLMGNKTTVPPKVGFNCEEIGPPTVDYQICTCHSIKIFRILTRTVCYHIFINDLIHSCKNNNTTN